MQPALTRFDSWSLLAMGILVGRGKKKQRCCDSNHSFLQKGYLQDAFVESWLCHGQNSRNLKWKVLG
jgi:hypothetical protein